MEAARQLGTVRRSTTGFTTPAATAEALPGRG